jgi:DNA/RNA endonuclease YhcR with UshA esterase domain
MKTLILSILIILTCNICYAQTEITPFKAKHHVGKYVIVTGEIMEVYESSIGNIFLNFEKKYPNNPFTVVIFANGREDIQSDFRINWVNLVNVTIRVTGINETYKDKPEIILKKADQIVGID